MRGRVVKGRETQRLKESIGKKGTGCYKIGTVVYNMQYVQRKKEEGKGGKAKKKRWQKDRVVKEEEKGLGI